MSLYDYQQSLDIAKNDPPFYALIMAALRKADSDNLDKLASAFPETVTELRRRYNAPGGQLPEDDVPASITLAEIRPEYVGKIVGIALTRTLYVDGKEISPTRSQNLRNHSPDGFSWGYGGSGPAQLALAICLELTNEKTALNLYQAFKFQFIAPLVMDKDFQLNLSEAVEYLS